MIGAEQRLKKVKEYAIQCIKEETDATLNLINQLDENFDKIGRASCRERVEISVVAV